MGEREIDGQCRLWQAIGGKGRTPTQFVEMVVLAAGTKSRLKHLIKEMIQNEFGHRIASSLIGLCAKFVYRTSRWSCPGRNELEQNFLQNGRRVIALMWHNRVALMPFGWSYRNHQLTALISDHRDGRLTTSILDAAGVHHIRVPATTSTHSTPQRQTRLKASTVREILKQVEMGRTISFVGDGPTGPRFVLKPSVIDLARLCKAEIVLVTYSVKRRQIAGSWDRLIIPLPFNRGIFRVSTWSYDPRGLNAKECEVMRAKIQADLRAFTDETDAMLGHAPIE